MPKAFNECVRGGGRVKTIKPKGKGSKTYLRVCYPKGGGKPVSGEVKESKDLSPDEKLKQGFRALKKP